MVGQASLRDDRQAVNLVKIDVEGHELTILKACQEQLACARPRAVLFEDHTRSTAPDGELGKLFAEMGYRVYSVRKHLTRLEYQPLLSADDCNSVDYLATPIA